MCHNSIPWSWDWWPKELGQPLQPSHSTKILASGLILPPTTSLKSMPLGLVFSDPLGQSSLCCMFHPVPYHLLPWLQQFFISSPAPHLQLVQNAGSKPTRYLRSSHSKLAATLHVFSARHGGCFFSYLAPNLWNKQADVISGPLLKLSLETNGRLGCSLLNPFRLSSLQCFAKMPLVGASILIKTLIHYSFIQSSFAHPVPLSCLLHFSSSLASKYFKKKISKSIYIPNKK